MERKERKVAKAKFPVANEANVTFGLNSTSPLPLIARPLSKRIFFSLSSLTTLFSIFALNFISFLCSILSCFLSHKPQAHQGEKRVFSET